MFNESTRRRRHNSSSSSNNSTTKQSTTATQKIATQSTNIMMGSNASDEPTMSWIIVCAILYVLSGVTQVSLYYTLYACSVCIVCIKVHI